MSTSPIANGSYSAQATRPVSPLKPEGREHDNGDTDPSTTTKLRLPTNQHSQPIQRLNDWWFWEIAGLAVSICAACAAVVVLTLFNGRPLQEWNYRLSINTVVSFLAIVSKASLGLVVEGCLGQLKWIWYSRPRNRHSLLHFQAFDEASRGPYGAAQLLFTLREINIGLVGAFVVLCALVYEPFIQQTISTPLLSSFLPTNSSLPIATSYAAYSFGGATQTVSNIELPMKAAIYDGIFYQNISATATAISPTCSTGNCTFEQYSSLYVCSQCVDVTSLVHNTCTGSNSSSSSCTYTLPNGLNGTQGRTLLQTSTGALSTTEFTDRGPTISNFSSILFNPDVSALDCILYFCGKTYQSSVVRGSFVESTEATVHADNDDKNGNLTVTIPASLLSSGKREVFAVQHITAAALGDYLQTLLEGFAHLQNYIEFGAPITGYSSDFLQALYNNPDINQTIANLATSMGNHIRLKGVSYASGTTEAMATYIHVRWLWLILPFSLEALTLLTLVTTTILSAGRGIPIWKSSALATMFHGLPIHGLKSERLENNEEMEKLAKDLHVILIKDNGTTVLKALPGVHDAEPLLPLRRVVKHREGSPS